MMFSSMPKNAKRNLPDSARKSHRAEKSERAKPFLLAASQDGVEQAFRPAV